MMAIDDTIAERKWPNQRRRMEMEKDAEKMREGRAKALALPEIPGELTEEAIDWLIRRGWRAALRTDVASLLAAAVAKAAKAKAPMKPEAIESLHETLLAEMVAKIADGTIGKDPMEAQHKEEAIEAEMKRILRNRIKALLEKAELHPIHRDGGNKGPLVYAVRGGHHTLDELVQMEWADIEGADRLDPLRKAAESALAKHEEERKAAQDALATLGDCSKYF
jgi:hypothetical protein